MRLLTLAQRPLTQTSQPKHRRIFAHSSIPSHVPCSAGSMPAAPSSPQKLNSATLQKKDAAPGQDKQTPMKPANFGKAIGIDKPANVRDKIRKWQADLEAEAAEVESASPAVAIAPSPKPSPKPKPAPKAAPLEGNLSPNPKSAVVVTPISPASTPLPERPKSAKKPAHNPLDEDVLIATAPKKRLVSDSHWRNKKSPPKDAAAPAKRASPKPLPTAWVRPAARRSAPSEAKTPESKPSTPSKPDPKSIIIFSPKSPAQRTRSARKRRASRPSSSGNDRRPTSSGSGSSKVDKAGDDAPTSPRSQPESSEKYELVRVRRRRKSAQSRRSSSSADDDVSAPRRPARTSETTSRGGTPNQITVEYESTLGPIGREQGKEKRRRSRIKDDGYTSPENSPKPQPSGRRQRSRTVSHLDDIENGRATLPSRGTPDPQNNSFGGRLQAWLQTTPDPFLDGDLNKRRKSKDSISTLDLPQKQDKSDITAPSNPKDEQKEETTERNTGSKRLKKPRRVSIQVETRDLDDRPSTVHSNDTLETPPGKDKDTATTPTSTPTLKRRGARRSQYSPTKARMESPPVESKGRERDAESSIVSSSVVSSSIVPSSIVSSSVVSSSVVSSSVDSSSIVSSSVDASTVEPELPPLRNRPDTLAMRRMFPTTGQRLSTIASVETFATKMQQAPSEAVGSEVPKTLVQNKNEEEVVASEGGSTLNAETLTILSRKSTRRNKLATHADLISVLSMPRAGTRSIVSARSIRTNRSRLATATIEDIMNELASDETKYMRELRTLVDGVIPVLLSCVLSKSDSAVAAGLFSRTSKVDPSEVTKPIVDMGVSLERLKNLHRRVPKDNANAFLSWTQSAQRVYGDYINSWRLGFEDVVISLAPADEDPFTPAKVVEGPADAAPWDEGLPRNAEGYVINGDGERVDVAYMLKRPLVRLKYLAKTIRVRPSSACLSYC